MKNILAVAGKDIRSYFVSPVAYVVTTGFLLLGGWFFFNLLVQFLFLCRNFLLPPLLVFLQLLPKLLDFLQLLL